MPSTRNEEQQKQQQQQPQELERLLERFNFVNENGAGGGTRILAVVRTRLGEREMVYVVRNGQSIKVEHDPMEIDRRVHNRFHFESGRWFDLGPDEPARLEFKVAGGIHPVAKF